MTPSDLTEARLRAKLTLQQLADLLGVNARTIRRWENGESRLGKVEQLAVEEILRSIDSLARH